MIKLNRLFFLLISMFLFSACTRIVENDGTPLILAVIRNDEAEIRKLLIRGYLIDGDVNGVTALSTAVEDQNISMVKLLLECGATTNKPKKRDGMTPLMTAAKKQNKEIVELLLKSGADVTLRDNEGNQAIYFAADTGNVDILTLLVEAGSPVEEPQGDGTTPLIQAAGMGHISAAAFLLDHGAGINTASTVFEEIKQSRIAPISVLLDNPEIASVNAITQTGTGAYRTVNNVSALLAAIPTADMVEFLIQRGADVNIEGEEEAGSESLSWTPLSFAAANGYYDIMLLLLNNGAKVNHVARDGATALLYGVDYLYGLSHMEILLEYGADVNLYAPGNREPPPLVRALKPGRLGILEFLIKNGARVNQRIKLLNADATPLAFAVYYKGYYSAELLLENGAEPNVTATIDGNTFTPLQLAIEKGLPRIEELLRSYGATE